MELCRPWGPLGIPDLADRVSIFTILQLYMQIMCILFKTLLSFVRLECIFKSIM